jgi:hypothetical protein
VCRGSCINLNREKTVAYSNQRINFVNAFNYTPMVDHHIPGRKRVDSSMLRESPRLWPCSAWGRCGKTEEGSGKKGGDFLDHLSRKILGASRTLWSIKGARNPEASSSKPAGPFAGSVQDKKQLYRVAAYAVRNDIRSAGNY